MSTLIGLSGIDIDPGSLLHCELKGSTIAISSHIGRGTNLVCFTIGLFAGKYFRR
jgi:hypothetical protein